MTFTEFMYKGFIGYYIEGHKFSTLFALYAAVIIPGIFCVVIPYLCGGVNFAIILSRLKYGEDIRNYGSGNAGMTNMLRTYGKGMAAATFIGDFLKAAIGVCYGRFIFGIFGAYLAGLFCVLGHMFPIYYRFKGGKGVVATAAMIALLDWRIFLILVVLFVLLVWATRYVSLGSVISAMLFPLLLSRFAPFPAPFCGQYMTPYSCVLVSLLVAGVVVFMHRQNISRLLSGTESKISLHKKAKSSEADGSNDTSEEK